MTSEMYFEIAETYYINSQYEKALCYFKKSFDLREDNDCLNYIGCCYLELNDFMSAIRIFRKIEKNSPIWERPILNLGRVYLKTKKFKKALSCFRRALSLNPENTDTLFYLGVYYYKIKEYEFAKTYYHKSLLIDNNQSETHLNLGMCYLKLKNYLKAIEEFEISFNLDTDCLDAIYNKGIALIALGKFQEALDSFLLFNNHKPTDIEVMLDIAHCYYKINDLGTSNVWINKLLSLEPQHELGNKLLKRISSMTQ